jgi:hypothetical protein
VPNAPNWKVQMPWSFHAESHLHCSSLSGLGYQRTKNQPRPKVLEIWSFAPD